MEALSVGDFGDFYLNIEPIGGELDYPSVGTKTLENVERMQEDGGQGNYKNEHSG